MLDEAHPNNRGTLTKSRSVMVLLVDDDPFVREFTRQTLEMSGFDVLEAVNGEEAIKTFSVNKEFIRLLIIDVMMPGMNGREVYEEISRMNPGISVIFISGYLGDVLRRNEILESGYTLVSKPFSPKELINTVQTVLTS